MIENRAIFERAGQVMAKIMENEKAAAALKHTGWGQAVPAVNAPDNMQEAAQRQG